MTKQLYLWIPTELHHLLKLKAATDQTTITKIITDLLEKELKNNEK